VLAASMSAGTDVLRRCDIDHLNRTAVESKSNRSCNHDITEQMVGMCACGTAVSVADSARGMPLADANSLPLPPDCEVLLVTHKSRLA